MEIRRVISLPGCTQIAVNYVFLLCWVTVCKGDLTDVTNSYMNGINAGILSAFGDYTADKATDIFMLSENSRDIDLIMNIKAGFQRKNLVKATAEDQGIITSIMPGDFNGDSLMDILVTRKVDKDTALIVQIYWTEQLENKQFAISNSSVLPDKFTDQPLLMDYNGDMIPDLYAQHAGDNKRYYWIASTNGTFTKELQILPSEISSNKIRTPNSNSFVDLNSDFAADLFVTSVDGSDKPQFEFWMSEFKGLTLNRSIDKPTNSGQYIGQSTFLDINGDSETEMVLPVCSESTCKESSIYAYVNNKWHLLVDSFVSRGVEWGFAPPALPNNVPVTLRAGDFDLDGYPDLLAIMRSGNAGENTQKAFILMNVPCGAQSACQEVGRTFQIEFGTVLQEAKDVVTATFYDLDGNGVLDILVQHYDAEMPKVLAFLNGFNKDACFMKVMVISGRCYHECPGGRPAYGTNQPGIAVYYETTGANGGQQTSIAGQLSQSAHYALQLPYVVFGLGLTPNFVDELQVGIPRGKQQSPKHRSWKSIIPNSQLVIIPHPPYDPDGWVNKLFVSPFTNKQVLYTAAALLGTLVFVGGIVGVLQWRERVEDKREKLQESQKFHFDAM